MGFWGNEVIVQLIRKKLFFLILSLSILLLFIFHHLAYRKLIFHNYNFDTLDSITEEANKLGFKYRGNFSDIQSKYIFFDKIFMYSQEYSNKVYLVFLFDKKTNKIKYIQNLCERKLSKANINCLLIENIYSEPLIICYESLDKLYCLTEIDQYYKLYISKK